MKQMKSMVTGKKNIFRLWILTILMFWSFGISVHGAEQEEAEKSCDIVFALDISGSMKKTDENRTAIEAIKLMADICDKGDRIGLVAYNDTIAYSLPLTPLNNTEEKEKLKEQISQITYQGETDMGLGMKQAVELLGQQENNREKLVILLSDGKTDLEHSSTGRTLEQSQADLEQAVQQAQKQHISIHTIAFANEYLDNTDYLTVLAADTKGTSQIAASPLNLNQMISEILFLYKPGKNTGTQVINFTQEEQQITLKLTKDQVKQLYIELLSTEKIQDIQIMEQEGEVIQAEKYAVIKLYEPGKNTVTLNIKAESGTKMILTMIEVLTSKPSPILSMSPTPLNTRVPATASPIPVAREEKSPPIRAVILGIGVVTISLMLLIIYLFFGRKKEVQVLSFSGQLTGEFIDLKSKNESVRLIWQLSEYPKEGVSLKELFHGAGFREDLPELDRLCFYPEKNRTLLLVHCMEGGVFLGEENIFPNKPARIQAGSVIYISFADNSSELELHYTL